MKPGVTGEVIHSVIFVSICFGIVSLAWNEPLQSHFMAPVEEPVQVVVPEPELERPTWFEDPNHNATLEPKRRKGR